MSRLLLLGSDGMLGAALLRVLGKQHRITALTRADFDIESHHWHKLPLAGHDYVLNAAGMINKRPVDVEKFYVVNAVFPHVLAGLCGRHAARLIHFSTDCVFEGTAAPYYEDAEPDAIDLYGRTKILGEAVSGMIIRTSIIGPEVKNGYNLMCWALRQREMQGYANVLWNGLTTVALANAVNTIITQNLHCDGVRHLHSTDCSKFDLVSMICAAFGSGAAITKGEQDKFRDVRLRTRYPALLEQLNIPPLAGQIAALPPLCRADGYWLA